MQPAALITHIRPTWFACASHRFAQHEGVRQGFLEQLNRFYDLLEAAVQTGDACGLLLLLDEWVNAQVSVDLEAETENAVSPLVDQLFMIVFEAARDMAPAEDALELFWALLPVKSRLLEHLHRQETETQVRRVTAEMEKAALALEQLDQSKSDFISVAAHELKTPLTLIEGYLAMLRERHDLDSGGITEEMLLDGIQSGARRLKEIVEDLVMVSMIDNNMLALHFQPFRVQHLLKLVSHAFADILQARQIQLEVTSFPGDEELTFGDEARLLQAFCNVVSNAIKYTPDGGSVRTGGRRLPGFIEVTINDTGIGIAPEDQERIFEKFGRLGKMSLHSSGKTKFMGGGPGLGLPISKGIFEAHGGTIWVESSGYDEVSCPGTTFHILLPLLQAPPEDRIAGRFLPQARSDEPDTPAPVQFLPDRPLPAGQNIPTNQTPLG